MTTDTSAEAVERLAAKAEDLREPIAFRLGVGHLVFISITNKRFGVTA